MTHAPTRRALALAASTALAVLLALLTTLPGPGAAVTTTAAPGPGTAPAGRPAPVQDPDRVSTTPAGWGWHTSVAPATMTAFIDTGQRITDLEVTQVSPLRFSAAYVANSGTYQRTWWWYYGQTASQVSQRLAANGARLTDLEAYATASGTRYAVVMVRNSGDSAKAWGWFPSATLAQIGDYAADNDMRVVDSERVTTGGQARYAAVLIRNTGVDAVSWWHYYGISATAVSQRLRDNKARLVSLERRTDGTLDVIMTKGGFSGSWWYATGRTAAQVTAFVNQVGGRIVQVDSRVVGATRYFDVIVLDNATAENRRIRNLVAAGMSGSWGFYVKRVGSGSPVAALNQDTVFEPASMIKTILAVHALRDVQGGGSTLASPVTWRQHPDHDARYPTDEHYVEVPGVSGDAYVCAYDGAGNAVGTPVTDPLGSVILFQMLRYSDNRAADAITDRYGFAALNATIAAAGMSASRLNHRDGCGSTWPDPPGYHNHLTLTDAGRLYEGVQDGTLLSAANRSALYGYLAGGVIPTTGPLAAMIKAEANAAGLTASERSDFLSRVVDESQSGKYSLCPDEGSCSGVSVQVRSTGGIVFLPFKGRGGVTSTPYVYGRFINTPVGCSHGAVAAGSCTAYNDAAAGLATISVEMFRAAVRSALATW